MTNHSDCASTGGNNKFFYREPMQVQTGDMRRVKIGQRTRLINIVQSQHYCSLNRELDEALLKNKVDEMP